MSFYGLGLVNIIYPKYTMKICLCYGTQNEFRVLQPISIRKKYIKTNNDRFLTITGGPRLVRFLGFGKNRTIRNSYQWVLHSQFPLVRILLHSNSTSTNFIPIAKKIVLVETVLVGNPVYLFSFSLRQNFYSPSRPWRELAACKSISSLE